MNTTIILSIASIMGAIMAAMLYLAVWVAGFRVPPSVIVIVGCVTAVIMVFEIRRLLR
jgi:flagellar motor component MotA